MNVDQRGRLLEILELLASLPDSRRADAARLLCGDDASLRAKVDEALSIEAQNQLLERIVTHAARTPDRPPQSSSATTVLGRADDNAVGRTIGVYKILERIGEGGFGEVFAAEQSEPIERRVAVKIIKPGMDSRAVVARFEAERQALAMMDHPNIAKVLDAGTTPAGRPYFVMELVRGVPITDYCEENRLSPRDRIELMIPVCQAIQHAHQKGIIHRDIKPGNVLVTIVDGKPVPKVIDFGIAKAMAGASTLTDKTIYTAFRQFIGTPAYMSPEQLLQSGVDVDTRSDVYALGVLMYELLSGSLPFDTESLLKEGLDRMQQVVREQDPPKPSTRVMTMDAGKRTSVAAARRLQPDKLGGVLRGEMDWMVMKAVEKDRNRRYQSPTEFADDLQRFLDGDAVKASPPSGWYRARKFVRRNRVAVALAAVAGVGLAATAVGTSIGLRREALQRQIAEAESERAVKATAQAEEALASLASRQEALIATNNALDQILASGNPLKPGGDAEITVPDAVERTSASLLDGGISDNPEVRITVLTKLGKLNIDLGRYEVAARLGESARALASSAFGEDSIQARDALSLAVMAYGFAWRTDKTEELGRALVEQEARLDPGSQRHISARFQLGSALARMLTGDGFTLIDDSITDFERSVRTEDDRLELVRMQCEAATLHALFGRLSRAESLMVSIDARLAREQQEGPVVRKLRGEAALVRALIFRSRGYYAEAAKFYRTGLDALPRDSASRPNRFTRVDVMRSLGLAALDSGDLDQAESVLTLALSESRALKSAVVMSCLQGLADIARARSQPVESVRLCEELVQVVDAHPHEVGYRFWILSSRARLALAYEEAGNEAEAERMYREVMASAPGPIDDRWGRFRAAFYLARRSIRLGRVDEAEAILRSCLPQARKFSDEPQGRAARCLELLGLIEAQRESWSAAERNYALALKEQVDSRPGDIAAVKGIASALAYVRRQLGEIAGAEAVESTHEVSPKAPELPPMFRPVF